MGLEITKSLDAEKKSNYVKKEIKTYTPVDKEKVQQEVIDKTKNSMFKVYPNPAWENGPIYIAYSSSRFINYLYLTEYNWNTSSNTPGEYDNPNATGENDMGTHDTDNLPPLEEGETGILYDTGTINSENEIPNILQKTSIKMFDMTWREVWCDMEFSPDIANTPWYFMKILPRELAPGAYIINVNLPDWGNVAQKIIIQQWIPSTPPSDNNPFGNTINVVVTSDDN